MIRTNRPSTTAAFILGVVIVLPTALRVRAEGLPEGISQNLVLSPTPNNPRNSEGDFLHLADGRILFIYSHFTGGARDDSPAYLASRVSSDSGKTWSDHDETVIAPEAHRDVQNIMSVSLLRLKEDRIAMFYLVRKSDSDCAMVMRTSTDEAKTWTEPTVCTGERGYYLVNNSRVLRLKSGRIIFPATRRDPPPPGGFRRGMAICCYSDDDGLTWHRSKSTLEAPPNSHSGFQHPAIVELNDGRLMMLISMHLRPLLRSYSSDGGDTWSPPETTDLPAPVAPASVKRIASTGDLLMVWNDHSHIDPAGKGKRTPLTIAVSRDQGKTWEHRKNLYDSPDGGYGFTAIDFAGDRVLLGHNATDRAKGASAMGTTVITSFEITWLYRQ